MAWPRHDRVSQHDQAIVCSGSCDTIVVISTARAVVQARSVAQSYHVTRPRRVALWRRRHGCVQQYDQGRVILKSHGMPMLSNTVRTYYALQKKARLDHVAC